MPMTRRQFLHYLAIISSTSGWAVSSGHSYASLLSEPDANSRHTRIIPSSGEKIPAIGLGSWLTFGIDISNTEVLNKRIALLHEFLQKGGGLLDSSPMYGTAEEVIGKGLERLNNHHNLFSATKVWTSGNRQGALQMEQSRQLWGVDRLDLMQVHNLLDWETHLPSLHAMKQAGDIRYVGVTTSHGRRHKELEQLMRTQALDFVQFTYNMLDREAENILLPLARDRGIAVIINRPFQRGGLFERFESYPLPPWSVEIDCENWAQFFLKFIISHPAVTCAIPATSQLAHLRENMAAGYGELPDRTMRQKMIQYIKAL